MRDIILVFTGLFTVAVIAVLVSQKANTDKVIQALGTGTSDVLKTAVSPVTGS